MKKHRKRVRSGCSIANGTVQTSYRRGGGRCSVLALAEEILAGGGAANEERLGITGDWRGGFSSPTWHS